MYLKSTAVNLRVQLRSLCCGNVRRSFKASFTWVVRDTINTLLQDNCTLAAPFENIKIYILNVLYTSKKRFRISRTSNGADDRASPFVNKETTLFYIYVIVSNHPDLQYLFNLIDCVVLQKSYLDPNNFNYIYEIKPGYTKNKFAANCFISLSLNKKLLFNYAYASMSVYYTQYYF